MIFTEWISPFDPDLVIASFTLVYQLIEATIDISTPRPFVKIENITDTTYILQSLLINSVYSMYVYAVTIDGQGPSSDKLIISTTNEGRLLIHFQLYAFHLTLCSDIRFE